MSYLRPALVPAVAHAALVEHPAAAAVPELIQHRGAAGALDVHLLELGLS